MQISRIKTGTEHKSVLSLSFCGVNYVFFKKNLMVYSEIFHNDDTFHAYNETIVNIIITSV